MEKIKNYVYGVKRFAFAIFGVSSMLSMFLLLMIAVFIKQATFAEAMPILQIISTGIATIVLGFLGFQSWTDKNDNKIDKKETNLIQEVLKDEKINS